MKDEKKKRPREECRRPEDIGEAYWRWGKKSLSKERRIELWQSKEKILQRLKLIDEGSEEEVETGSVSKGTGIGGDQIMNMQIQMIETISQESKEGLRNLKEELGLESKNNLNISKDEIKAEDRGKFKELRKKN